MKPRFRHDMDRNYMVLEASESLQGNEYQVRMLLANDIPGCLKARMRMIDNKIEFFTILLQNSRWEGSMRKKGWEAETSVHWWRDCTGRLRAPLFFFWTESLSCLTLGLCTWM